MNQSTAQELARLQRQADAMRAVLVGLLQDVVKAESRLEASQASQLLEANERLVLAALRDQGEAETASQALQQVSLSTGLDPLTQLPNRVLLLDRLNHAIAHARRRGRRVALLFIDLDRFKVINDSLGHAVGDQVLLQAARCLLAGVRAEDTVSRYGGDEFLILLGDVIQADDACAIAEKLLAALAVPEPLGEHVIPLSASIGISCYPDDAEDAQALIERADAAMYRAKRHAPGSYVRHGDEAIVAVGSAGPSSTALQRLQSQVGADQERRQVQLREANEQLVLAGLTAQDLQAIAEQAQKRQLEFLAVIAHELRDPLAPIRFAASMLSRVTGEGSLVPQARAIIERQVESLSRLVADLLDASRVGRGKLTLELRRVDLADIVTEAVASCGPAIDARVHKFELALPDEPVCVLGDPLRLVQVLSNLLNNAAKYTPVGGKITLTLAGVDASATLTVADNGIGISAEALPNVFDPFVQDAHAVSFSGFGLGIGLTVVREIVQAHGGSVAAISDGRESGSRFVVTLPLLDPRT